ncbi:gem (nuclear organelle) associated protein 2 [Quaeritorhiza haematococci]|nr:gem (nuclear organelle) associated protein 2 [Quaeritorhiza haematococci]
MASNKWTNDPNEEGLKRRALPVDEYDVEDFNENGPPASGLEYLLRVRKEADSCPQVVVAEAPAPSTTTYIPDNLDVRKRYFKEQEVGPVLLDCIRPSRAWRDHLVEQVVSTREHITKRLAHIPPPQPIPKPHLADEKGWKQFCYGKPSLASADYDITKVDGTETTSPDPNELQNPDLDTDMSSSYSKEGVARSKLPPAGFTPSSNVMCCLEQAQWLFTLLLWTDSLLMPEQVSLLRDISRKCQQIRAAIAEKYESECRVEEASRDERFAALNMVVAVIAEVFGQRDLR